MEEQSVPPLAGGTLAFRPPPRKARRETARARPGWSSPAEGALSRQLWFVLTLVATVLLAGVSLAGEAGVLADQRTA